MARDEARETYRIGVMVTPVETMDGDFSSLVEGAVEQVERILTNVPDLNIAVFDFEGPHLSPVAGAYSPLDFLQLGIAEKVERDVHFLLIVTEVELSAEALSYTLALPSQLANVGILTTRRLSPDFWGERQDRSVTRNRLAMLMVHTLGHLLNLPHESSPENAMYDFRAIEDLDRMHSFSEGQVAMLHANFPREAPEKVGESHWPFGIRQAYENRRKILGAVRRANPLRLVTALPTMITAAISLIVVLFFSAETWDLSGAVEWYQLALFTVVSLVVGTSVLYRAFALGVGRTRQRRLPESAVIIQVTTALSLFLTQLFLYLIFFFGVLLASETIFPEKLMETWSTVDPVRELEDHGRLGMFLAAMGVLAGSLGGRADSKALIRRVIFLDEEA